MTNRFDIDPNGPPCVRYDPKKVPLSRLAPPPPDPPEPEKVSKTIGKNTAPLTEARRLAAELRKTCPRHRWKRVGLVRMEFGVKRVRARCSTCKAEKIVNDSEIAVGYLKRGPKKKV